ncbi:MAG: TrmH family RNA methyltransferase [Candidatus Andersenbacteria bacterium]
MIAILDSIRSAHNVGSIFRTADAVGVSKLYLCGLTPAPLDRFGRRNLRLTKVSLGAEYSVLWEQVTATVHVLKKLKKQGLTIVALEQAAQAKNLFMLTPPSAAVLKKTALVVGPEVTGLAPAILEQADSIVEIPMRGKKESLNVAVAFGVATYWLCQKAIV